MTVKIPDKMREYALFFLSEDDADRWISDLPRMLEWCEETWKIEVLEVLTGGVMSCCAKCVGCNGRYLILKIPLNPADAALEAAALTEWSNSGGVPQLVENDSESGAMLMEYIEPSDSQAEIVQSLASLFQRLHGRNSRISKPSVVFPPLQANVELRLKWARDRFAKPEYAEGIRFLGPAERNAHALLEKNSDYRQLLHGDLQHKNIIMATSGRSLAIDPMPVVGDVHYDAAFWCVMEESGNSVYENLSRLVDNVDFLEFERAHSWALALAAIEFRPYLPTSRDRLLQFLTNGA